MEIPLFQNIQTIPAKMRLESQYLCGVSEGTVEMKRARFVHGDLMRRNIVLPCTFAIEK